MWGAIARRARGRRSGHAASRYARERRLTDRAHDRLAADEEFGQLRRCRRRLDLCRPTAGIPADAGQEGQTVPLKAAIDHNRPLLAKRGRCGRGHFKADKKRSQSESCAAAGHEIFRTPQHSVAPTIHVPISRVNPPLGSCVLGSTSWGPRLGVHVIPRSGGREEGQGSVRHKLAGVTRAWWAADYADANPPCEPAGFHSLLGPGFPLARKVCRAGMGAFGSRRAAAGPAKKHNFWNQRIGPALSWQPAAHFPLPVLGRHLGRS
jgi:hypothetical protein